MLGIAEDAICGEITDWVDSGSYALNALLSGSIFKGFPSNKIIGFVGSEATGKTFYTLAACKNFLDTNPKGVVVYFETENALTKDTLSGRGIALDRFVHLPVSTVQEFKNQALRIVDEKLNDKDDLPLLFVLDSLGNLSTNKEMEDSASGSDTKDMTRAQIIKATFRVLALKLGMANIPMIFTNHVYDKIGSGLYAGKEQGGGCLLPGTKVLMDDGSYKNIEDIKIGDCVSTLAGKKKVLTCWDKTNLIDPEPDCLKLTFDDGFSVECSNTHRFLIFDDLWVEAKDLMINDSFKTDKAKVKLIKIEKIGKKQVYDIEVEDVKHYILENGIISHNSGSKYASSITVSLTKAKEKDGDEVIGSVISCTAIKSRLVREQIKVKTLIRFNGGLDRYFGLIDLAEKCGAFKKVSTKYEMPDGKKYFEKAIERNPEKFFTTEILDMIENWVQKNFKYGVASIENDIVNDEEVPDE